MVLVLLSPLLAAELTGTVEGELSTSDVLVEAIDPSLRVLGETTVGADGSFHLEDLPSGLIRLRASPILELEVADSYYPDGDSWCEGALVELDHGQVSNGFRIIMEQGGTVTGTILAVDGSPAVGAAVVATPVDEEPIDWQRSVEVADDGRFTLTGIPTVAAGVRLALVHDDMPDTNVGGYDLVDAEKFILGQGEVLDLGELRFGEGVSLSGRVEDEQGDPVAGVDVRVRIGAVSEKVETNEDGSWSMSGLRAGDAEVWLTEDGLAVHYWPGEDRPAEKIHLSDDGDSVTDVLLQASQESTLSGVIVGGPSGLGELTLKAVNDDATVKITVEVDDDGGFTAHRLAPGEWSLLVRGTELGGVEDSVRDEQGRVLTWQVGTGEQRDVGELPWVFEAVLTGRVVDPDGLPVQGATITAFPDAEDLPQVSATTDDHGRYRLLALVEGPYRLRAAVEPPCAGDPDFVDTWWPAARMQAKGQVLRPVAESEVAGLDLVVPFDRDHDGMDDDWEIARGLDPQRNDGAEDPDDDGYSNLEEYQLDTDPLDGGRDGTIGGCSNPLSLSWLLLPVVGLGRRRRF